MQGFNGLVQELDTAVSLLEEAFVSVSCRGLNNWNRALGYNILYL